MCCPHPQLLSGLPALLGLNLLSPRYMHNGMLKSEALSTQCDQSLQLPWSALLLLQAACRLPCSQMGTTLPRTTSSD